MRQYDFTNFDLLSKLLSAPPTPTSRPAIRFDLLSALAAPPPAPALPQGIWFDSVYFSEPAILSLATIPAFAGLYAILVFDFAAKPRPYRPIYFGKAENLKTRVTASHEKHADWSRVAGGPGYLYVAYHFEHNPFIRTDQEKGLIERYAPECNLAFNPLAVLLGR